MIRLAAYHPAGGNSESKTNKTNAVALQTHGYSVLGKVMMYRTLSEVVVVQPSVIILGTADRPPGMQ